MKQFDSDIRYVEATPRRKRRQKGSYSSSVVSGATSSGDNAALRSYVDATFVSLLLGQEITADHNFLNGFSISGIPFRKMANGSLFIDANVVFGGGVTMYGTDSTPAPSIFDGLPIDGRTIKRDGNGALYVDETALSISGGGGVADSVAWANVVGKPTWITDTKPTYNYSEILNTPDLSVYALASAIPTNNNQLTNGAGYITALALIGYATQTFVNTAVNGAKEWVEEQQYLTEITSGMIESVLGYQPYDGDTNRLGFLTSSALNGYATQTFVNTALSNYLPLSGGTINGLVTISGSRADGGKNYILAPFLKTSYCHLNVNLDNSFRTTLLGKNDTSNDFIKPFRLGGSDQGVLKGNYAPIMAWGVGDTHAFINISPYATNKQNSQIGGGVGDKILWTEYLLHSGNFADYALPLTGGTLKGKFRILLDNTASNSSVVANAILNYIGAPYGLLTRIYSSGAVGLQAQREASDAECFNLFLNHLGGNVAVGGTTASAKLHVYGDLLTTGGITMYSQRSLKNILSYDGLSLEQLSVIKPIKFTWKDGRDNRYHVGGVADDVETVVPEVVYSANDFLTMDYGNAGFYVAASLIKPVIYCHNKVEEHEKDIDYLKRENVAIKKENKALRDEINQLKQAS